MEAEENMEQENEVEEAEEEVEGAAYKNGGGEVENQGRFQRRYVASKSNSLKKQNELK